MENPPRERMSEVLGEGSSPITIAAKNRRSAESLGQTRFVLSQRILLTSDFV